MKKNIITISTLLLIVFISSQSCKDTNTDQKTETGIQPDTHCVNAPKSWFAGITTVAPNDYGPFVDTSTTSDCDFHRWSWQKFLSLTRSAGKAPFESLIQVSNDLDPLGSALLLTDSSQAGSHGSLYDKTNRALFYSIYVNKTMFDFQQKYLPIFKTNINNLHSQGYDTLNYPVGCLEVKASWILASSLKNAKEYYTTTATMVTAAGSKTVTVALVGMHVLGRVANHPELIWATFEHENIAPDYDWSTFKGTAADTTTKIVSNKDFLLYNANTPVSGCTMNNNAQSQPGFKSIYNMFTYGMAETFVKDTLGLPSHRDSANNANIVALNKSVLDYLKKESSPWKHYFYKGSMWLDDPTPASFAPGNFNLGALTNPFLRGSRAISNISMETFAQIDYSNIYATGSINCFACHGTIDFKNNNNGISYNLALSHLFINALQHRIDSTAAKTP